MYVTNIDGLPAQLVTHLSGASPALTPRQLWTAWSWEPLVLLSLAVPTALYWRGVRLSAGRGVKTWQIGAYAAGIAIVFIALVSPLDRLSLALFSAHMVQHLLLILVAAPLLVFGSPLLPMLWALPLSWRRRLGRGSRRPGFRGPWRTLSRPSVAWLLAAGTLWLWHLPVLYQAALHSENIHAVEHACLLVTALLFWYVLIGPGGRRRCGYAPAVAYLLAMAVQSSVLGVVLAFSQPWYPAYAASAAAWHLTPAEDQQIAGLIMWIPAGAIYLIAVLALIVRWLDADERDARRRERSGARPSTRPIERTAAATAAAMAGERREAR